MEKQIDIIYRGEKSFRLAMQLVFSQHYENPKQSIMCMGYSIDDNSMYLFGYRNNDKLPIIEFPYEMNCDEVSNFVWGWLQKTNPREKDGWYGGDGDNIKGWKISTDNTGVGSDNWGAFIKIQPYYLYYGK